MSQVMKDGCDSPQGEKDKAPIEREWNWTRNFSRKK